VCGGIGKGNASEGCQDSVGEGWPHLKTPIQETGKQGRSARVDFPWKPRWGPERGGFLVKDLSWFGRFKGRMSRVENLGKEKALSRIEKRTLSGIRDAGDSWSLFVVQRRS